jgi:hypothetical protein
MTGAGGRKMTMLVIGVSLAGIRKQRDLREAADTKAIIANVATVIMDPHGEGHETETETGTDPIIAVALLAGSPRGTTTTMSTNHRTMMHGKMETTSRTTRETGMETAVHPRIEDREPQDLQRAGIKITIKVDGVGTTIDTTTTGTMEIDMKKGVHGARKAMSTRKTGEITDGVVEAVEVHHVENSRTGITEHHQSPKVGIPPNQPKRWNGDLEMSSLINGQENIHAEHSVGYCFLASRVATIS